MPPLTSRRDGGHDMAQSPANSQSRGNWVHLLQRVDSPRRLPARREHVPGSEVTRRLRARVESVTWRPSPSRPGMVRGRRAHAPAMRRSKNAGIVPRQHGLGLAQVGHPRQGDRPVCAERPGSGLSRETGPDQLSATTWSEPIKMNRTDGSRAPHVVQTGQNGLTTHPQTAAHRIPCSLTWFTLVSVSSGSLALPTLRIAPEEGKHASKRTFS